jgi:hypothetical protein
MEKDIQTFNSGDSKRAQAKLCEDHKYPHFAPKDGNCYRCWKNIYTEIDHGNYKTGISVERASSDLITGCPHCHYSYCD